MVSPVAAGLNDSLPVSRRLIRRAVSLAVAGLVLVIAGLAAWVLGATGGVVPQSAADITQLAGVSLVAAGAVCGLVMIVTLLAAGRVLWNVDTLPAAGEPDDAAELEGPGGLDAVAPPSAGSPAPEPLPERVPLAEWLPSRPGDEPAPLWSPESAAGPPPLPPAPAWSPEGTAEPTLPPVPQWSPEPAGPEAPQPVPPWSTGTPSERVPEPGLERAHEPAADPVPEPAPEWAHEPAAEWVPGHASVPTADQSAGAPVTGLEAAPDEQSPDRDRAGRASRKPAVGWNPDSAEDWLRVLRGLRVSEQAEADGHLSRED
jgi:hypothetical protein